VRYIYYILRRYKLGRYLKPNVHDKRRIRNVHTDGKWILYVQKRITRVFFSIIGRGNYVTRRLALSRMAASYRQRTPASYKTRLQFSFSRRARFDFVPAWEMNKAGRAKFDAERVIYGGTFFPRDYAHRNALKSNEFLQTRKNMRLHESQNFSVISFIMSTRSSVDDHARTHEFYSLAFHASQL